MIKPVVCAVVLALMQVAKAGRGWYSARPKKSVSLRLFGRKSVALVSIKVVFW
jgi:hypothetical protein